MARILVTGAGGQLGAALHASLGNHEVRALTHAELDIGDREAVEQAVGELVPDVIVNAAAMTNVDACEVDPDAAYRTNALALRWLAIAANRVDAHVVHTSTDYVFSGVFSGDPRPYREWDEVGPISEYSRSKLGGEIELASHARSWTIARTSWVFGRPGSDFVSWVLDAARRGDLEGVIDDQRSSPTLAGDLASVLARFAIERRLGMFHVTNQGSCSRFGMARDILELADLDPDVPTPIDSTTLDRPARRPEYSVLDNAAMRIAGIPRLRHYRDALADYIASAGLAATDTTARSTR